MTQTPSVDPKNSNRRRGAVSLRALEPDDAGLLYVWENTPDNWEAGDRRWPVSLSDIKSLIDHSDLDIWQTRQTRFMIEVYDVESGGQYHDHLTLGCIDVFDFDPLNMTCKLGVLVAHAWRGLGIAQDAIREVESFVRDTLCVHTVVVNLATDNVACLKAFTRQGYTKAGVLNGHIRRRHQFIDEVILQKVFAQ